MTINPIPNKSCLREGVGGVVGGLGDLGVGASAEGATEGVGVRNLTSSFEITA